MPVPLLSKEEAQRRLKEHGCEYVERFDDGHSIWKTPWGHHFIVEELPPAGQCSEWLFNELVEQEIIGTRPSTHD